MLKLRFINDVHKGRTLPLEPDHCLSIGRSSACTLQLQEASISRQHASLQYRDGQWLLEDNSSRSGTAVNGAPITGPVALQLGDVIGIGPHQLLVTDSSAAGSDSQFTVLPARTSPPPPPHDDAPELPMAEGLQLLQDVRQRLRTELGRIIVGQHNIVDQLLVALFARGHCLLLGVPGLAKTLLIQCLGQVLDLQFSRIQFTPDLMPSDITGTEILDEEVGSNRRSLRFVKGPVFTNLLLADEINRTPPKTQAALLEAMQEGRVTSGGERFHLPLPFFVLATQNPLEQEGTYPLPEAQLDRFMFLLQMSYPDRAEEIQILRQTTGNADVQLDKLLNAEQILDLQRLVRQIPVSEHVLSYCADLVRATRPDQPDADPFIRNNLVYGAGPRAGQYFVLAAKARAALDGRYNVCCNDVRHSAHAVLAHRIRCSFHAASEGIDAAQVIDWLLRHIAEPTS